MKVEFENVDQVVKRPVKDGRVLGLTEWNGKIVKILIMENDAPTEEINS